MTTIHLTALRHSAFYTPYLLTIAGGYLRAEGLNPRYSIVTPERSLAQMFASGACDVAQAAVATSFAALERGERPDVLHFAQINSRDGFFLVGRHPAPAFSWSSLAKARILVDHFFQPLAMFRYAVYQRGIATERLHIIDAGTPEGMERAFRDGAGDYVHLQGPAAQQLEYDGVGFVVASVGDAVGDVAFSSLCARREWLGTDAAHAFMRAYRQALYHANEVAPEDIAAQLQDAGFFAAIDRRVLAATTRAYQSMHCWRTDPVISPTAYERLLDVFEYGRAITRRHPYGAAIVAPPL